MSRVGRKPVLLSKEVQVEIKQDLLTIKGPKGVLTFAIPSLVTVKKEEGQIVVLRKQEDRLSKAQHGLVRNLIQNMVSGVTQTFSKSLEIQGVGYRAEMKGKALQLSLGFSHPVLFPVPEGIQIEMKKPTELTIRGCDKHLVGQTAARIRQLKLPEPYQGKGIRYAGEVVRRKVGKQAAGATGG